MLFMMCFSMNPGATPKAVAQFLAAGGQEGFGDETKLIQRYHAPGSAKGWLVVETDNIQGLYEHCSAWGEYLTWEVHPVATDEEAGPVCAKVWGGQESK